MKRLVLIFLISWSLLDITCAQCRKHESQCKMADNQKIIEINFSEKSLPEYNFRHINKGEFYKIKLEGINLNLYKVLLNVHDTVPGKPLETPAFGNFNLDILSKLVAAVGPMSASVTQAPVKPLVPPSEQQKVTFEKIDWKMDSTICYQTSFTRVAEEDANEIDTLKLYVYKIRLNSLRIDYKYSLLDVENILKHIRVAVDAVKELRTRIQKSSDSYDGLSYAIKESINKYESLAAKDKTIKSSFIRLQGFTTDLLSSITADKVYELLMPLVSIQNNAKNTYTSLPMQFMGNQANIKISVVPRDEKLNLQTYNTQIVFPVKKTYADIGLSYYVSKLCDSAYTIVETVSPDTSYSVKKEQSDGYEMGLTALLRVGKKFGGKENFGGHISMGAGISISNKVKPRLFAGAGLSYGEKNMIALDAGAAMGYVDRLSDGVTVSTDYQFKPETIIVSKPDIRLFIALGYIYHF
jgi:hypothetical protein